MKLILFKSLKEPEVKILPEFKPGSWVVVEAPSDSELVAICEEFKLNSDIVRDALDPYEVSRIEQDSGHEYIFTRFVYEKERQYHTCPILVIITDGGIISISREHFSPLDRFQGGQVTFATTQKIKLFIQIFLEAVYDYQRVINTMRKSMRGSTANIEKINNADVVKFVDLENIFNEMLSSLEPTGITLEKLLSGNYLKLYENDKDLVEDLFLTNTQLIKLCVSDLKHITSVREAYGMIISNNLNRTMKLLTALTVIFTVPMIIASLYGMNILLPFQHHQHAFYIVAGIIAVLSGLLFLVFRRKDLL